MRSAETMELPIKTQPPVEVAYTEITHASHDRYKLIRNYVPMIVFLVAIYALIFHMANQRPTARPTKPVVVTPPAEGVFSASYLGR